MIIVDERIKIPVQITVACITGEIWSFPVNNMIFTRYSTAIVKLENRIIVTNGGIPLSEIFLKILVRMNNVNDSTKGNIPIGVSINMEKMRAVKVAKYEIETIFSRFASKRILRIPMYISSDGM